MQPHSAEQLSQVAENRCWFVHLAPGNPNHLPPRGLEATIAFTVRLERATRSMCFAAVQLDDHSLSAPEAVGFYPSSIELQKGIELGIWEIRTGE